MEERKYELIMDDSIDIDGNTTLYRIKALRNFGNVIAGELGGYVQGYHNLSHEDDCWIYDDAKVYDNAKVYGNAAICDDAEVYSNARVYGDAKVYDNALIHGNAAICDDAEVYSNARVFGNARVFCHAEVYGNARVSGNAEVYGNARVYGDAEVYGNARVYGDARVFGYVEVYGNARVYDNAIVHDDAEVYGNARVFGDAEVYNNAWIFGDAKISNRADISSNNDYICIKGIGSANRYTTAFKESDGSVHVNCGCFNGTLDEFESKVRETHGDNLYGGEYTSYIRVIRDHFNSLQTKENKIMEERKLEVFDINELKKRLTKKKENMVLIRWFDCGAKSSLFSETDMGNDVYYSLIQNEHICEFAKTYCNLTIYNKEYRPVPKSIASISLNMYNPDTLPEAIDVNKLNVIIDAVIFDGDMSIADQKLHIDVVQRYCIDSFKLRLNIRPNDIQGSSILDLFDAVFEKMDIILKNDYSNYLMGF